VIEQKSASGPVVKVLKLKTEKFRTDERPHAAELELLARLMDSVFHVPGLGIRFGLDALIGLIPGLGDIATSLVSLYILKASSRLGVPRVMLARMALNIAIDCLLGSLPIVGDLFDIWWKANQKNVGMLQRHLQATPAEERRARAGDWLFVAGLAALVLVLLAGSVTLAILILNWLGHLVATAAR